MADADAQPDDSAAPDDAHEHAKGLAKAHTIAAHSHLTDALGYLGDDNYDPGEDATAGPDADDSAGGGDARGMGRFAQLSATKRGGFPAGSGAARTMNAIRGGR